MYDDVCKALTRIPAWFCNWRGDDVSLSWKSMELRSSREIHCVSEECRNYSRLSIMHWYSHSHIRCAPIKFVHSEKKSSLTWGFVTLPQSCNNIIERVNTISIFKATAIVCYNAALPPKRRERVIWVLKFTGGLDEQKACMAGLLGRPHVYGKIRSDFWVHTSMHVDLFPLTKIQALS